MKTEDFNSPFEQYYSNQRKLEKSRNKKIAIIVIAAILAVVIFISALVFGIMSMFRNHPAYHVAISYIESHPGIVEMVGEVEGFGSFPSGSISTSGGRGEAEFTIRVNGSEGTVRVHIQLEREPLRDWEVISIFYRR